MAQIARKCASARVLALAVVAVSLVVEPSASAETSRHLTDPVLDAELVVDAGSGKVLFARNDAVPRHPASLTKMMTLYLLFEQLAVKRLTLQSEIQVSAHAAAQPRSHLRLREGSTLPVETAIRAIVVCSANDAAVAVAEAIGTTESHFAELMTARAREFGMVHTFYRNASGLPDGQQVTTAGDLAILARRLIYDYPQYFSYFGVRSMIWRGQDVNTHNMLIGNYRGADGIKTGYIDAAGYNLVATAMRDNTRLIAIVMGGYSAQSRDEKAVDLLDDGFAQMKQTAAGLPVSAPDPASATPAELAGAAERATVAP